MQVYPADRFGKFSVEKTHHNRPPPIFLRKNNAADEHENEA